MRSTLGKIPAVAFLIAGGLAAILLLGLLIPSISQSIAAPPPGSGGPGGGGPGGNTTCGSTTTYYTYQASNAAGAGSTANFGADLQVANVGEALAAFDKTLCTDPLALAAYEEFFAHGENMSQTVAEERAAVFVKDHAVWGQTANAVRDQVASAKLTESDARFDSLGMVLGDNPTVMPKLTKFAELPVMGQTLELTLKNGEVRDLRIKCRLQPSVPKTFTKVTVEKKVEQKPTCTENCGGVCTVNCNPVCTVNCNPVCTVNCQPVCPIYGTYPNCYGPKDPSLGTQNQGNNRPGGGGLAPAQTDPVGPPAAGNPSTTYQTPVAPAPQPAPVGNEPAPNPNPAGPRPIATPEPAAPPQNAAPTTAPCAPGKC